MRDELIQVFPTPLLVCPYSRNYDKELEWIKKQECKKPSDRLDSSKVATNRQSTDTFILDNPELKKIRTFIETKLYQYVTNVMESDDKLVITQSWLNISGKGESHHEHTHPNSIISGVWYPQINNKLPPILFTKRSLQRDVELKVRKYNTFNGFTFLLPLNAGELVLFPSNMNHRVPANKYDEERISLSFNTWPKGNMGDIDSLTYLPFDRLM